MPIVPWHGAPAEGGPDLPTFFLHDAVGPRLSKNVTKPTMQCGFILINEKLG